METTFTRNKASKALINTDNVGLEAYRKRRNHVSSVEGDINTMKLEIQEIKALLQLLISKD